MCRAFCKFIQYLCNPVFFLLLCPLLFILYLFLSLNHSPFALLFPLSHSCSWFAVFFALGKSISTYYQRFTSWNLVWILTVPNTVCDKTTFPFNFLCDVWKLRQSYAPQNVLQPIENSHRTSWSFDYNPIDSVKIISLQPKIVFFTNLKHFLLEVC